MKLCACAGRTHHSITIHSAGHPPTSRRTRVKVDVNVAAKEGELRRAALDRALDDLDLLRDRRQHLLVQPVELVEAAPGAALDQAGKDPPHRPVVDPFVAVEDQHLPPK